MAKRKRQKSKFGRALLVTFLVVGAASSTALIMGYRFYGEAFPNVAILKTNYPHVIPRGEKEPPLIKIEKAKPASWVPLSAISPQAVGAIIVSEDWAFYQHKGYDPVQIREAVNESLEEGHFVRGASTITQQVAKNIFLSRDKTLWRKLRELVLALRLERDLGKKKILELYLNVAEWGPKVFGIGPAAQYYFQKAPIDLTAKEGAFLALLLPSPIRYGQSFRKHVLTEFASDTMNSILDKMVTARFLTEEERQQVGKIPLSFEAVAQPGTSPEATKSEDESEKSDAAQEDSPAPEVLFDEPEHSGT